MKVDCSLDWVTNSCKRHFPGQWGIFKYELCISLYYWINVEILRCHKGIVINVGECPYSEQKPSKVLRDERPCSLPFSNGSGKKIICIYKANK